MQSVAAGDDEWLHAVLTAFFRRTGVPMLCNTSLNDKGEPIVDRAAEAINFCVRKGIRVAYVDGMRIGLDPESAAARQLAEPDRRASAFFAGQAAARADLWLEWAEMGLSMEMLVVFSNSPDVRRAVSLDSAVGRRKLAQLTRLLLATNADEAGRVRRMATELSDRIARNHDLPPYSYSLPIDAPELDGIHGLRA